MLRRDKKIRTTGETVLPAWRARLLFILLLLGFAGMLGRAVYLQAVESDFLQSKGDDRFVRTVEIPAHRGKISDRNGEPLAISSPTESVWANPASVKINDKQLQKLAQILSLPSGELHKKLQNTEREFVYLRRQIQPELAAQVMALKIPGVALRREYRRFYPAGEALAHVIGITNLDDNGAEGLELALQEKLGGKPGSEQVIRDRNGYIVEDVASVRAPKAGEDVVLSIDLNLQYLAFREVQSVVERYHAKAGSIVILDAQSGEILALANWPSYNPNVRGKTSGDVMRNYAVTDLFEPGSTMKPFTVAAGLEERVIRPESRLSGEHGVLVVGGRKIHDTHPEDQLTITEVLQKSSNVGAAKIALGMKAEVFHRHLSQVGFGAKTGCEFPGEVNGRLRDPKRWVQIDQATMSYGNGIAVNLLQLARAYTALAHNGELKPITLLRREGPVLGEPVWDAATARTVRGMLEKVVAPGGTAPLAQIAGYRVAGKTGTAHKLENGRYVNKYIASFVGMAPVSNPRLIVAVMINEPSGSSYYGGQVAAPAFAHVMSGALRHLEVPFDAPLNNVLDPGDLDALREDA